LNPHSGLWEFWHVATGTRPRLGPGGTHVIDPEAGVVLVLLPGGRFRMGAGRGLSSSPSPSSEVPSHVVLLEPFFMAAHEITQGQWMRMTADNPSQVQGGDRYPDDLRLPVERVTWTEARSALLSVGLELPTEAQWEFAARGGTVSMWWCGDDSTCLEGAENVADLAGRSSGQQPRWQPVAWDDGFALTAPVGSFRPNPFGLHDVGGNVMEWTQDAFASYDLPASVGTGLRSVEGPSRVVRGGSACINERGAYSSKRNRFQASDRDFIGVRAARSVSSPGSATGALP
jgi:formylglycine-generating enzyme required for sulfatase activity